MIIEIGLQWLIPKLMLEQIKFFRSWQRVATERDV